MSELPFKEDAEKILKIFEDGKYGMMITTDKWKEKLVKEIAKFLSDFADELQSEDEQVEPIPYEDMD